MAALQPSQSSRPTPNIYTPHSLIPLARARAGTALGHRSLGFDRRPKQALAAPLEDAYSLSLSRSLLQSGPSRCDVSYGLVAPRPPRSPPRTSIDVSRSRHQTNVTAAALFGAARQAGEACCRAKPLLLGTSSGVESMLKPLTLGHSIVRARAARKPLRPVDCS